MPFYFCSSCHSLQVSHVLPAFTPKHRCRQLQQSLARSSAIFFHNNRLSILSFSTRMDFFTHICQRHSFCHWRRDNFLIFLPVSNIPSTIFLLGFMITIISAILSGSTPLLFMIRLIYTGSHAVRTGVATRTATRITVNNSYGVLFIGRIGVLCGRAPRAHTYPGLSDDSDTIEIIDDNICCCSCGNSAQNA